MIRINTLKTLECVKSIYAINDDLQIINTDTDYVKKVWISKRGYPMVSLETTNDKAMNVPVHKIVALAFIDNRADYELIEHLDDNKLNYQVDNLMFSNHSANGKRAFTNGCVIRDEMLVELVDNFANKYVGTIKEVSAITKISRATLYDNLYNERTPKKFKSIKLI